MGVERLRGRRVEEGGDLGGDGIHGDEHSSACVASSPVIAGDNEAGCSGLVLEDDVFRTSGDCEAGDALEVFAPESDIAAGGQGGHPDEEKDAAGNRSDCHTFINNAKQLRHATYHQWEGVDAGVPCWGVGVLWLWIDL